jgi:hypothetical protein
MNNAALSKFLENKIALELPLKHPEVYRVTYTPEFPGPLVSTIILSFPSLVCIDFADNRNPTFKFYYI